MQASGVPRCEDCLEPFKADEARFAVLKQTREWPPEVDPKEARELNALLLDQVFVCGGCAGWYGDHAQEVTAYEAGHA